MKNIIKNHKWTMVITSLLILIPMLVGLLLWNQLPEQIATHFGKGNVPNGWSSKRFTVFGMPLILLALQWLCFTGMSADPRKRNLGTKIFKAVLWIVPSVALLMFFVIYMMALGYEMNIGMVLNVLLGLLFLAVGNYLHKVKQNYTIGIKIPWTLNSEENWNRTHRMASWIWVAGGITFIINAFLQSELLMIVPLAVMVLIPVVYSFLLYKRGI